MAKSRRVVDVVLSGYFVWQVVSTILFDTQCLLPAWIYPKPLQNLYHWYLNGHRDPFLGATPSFPWYMSTCVVEFTLQIPFFVVAAYAYYKGAANCRWIRIPAIISSTHMLTSIISVLIMAMFEDFSSFTVPAPRTTSERLKLASVYFAYLIMTLISLFEAVFSSVYKEVKTKTG
ncbi:sigma intracellular receptor 2-like [Gigantopelta aegis]|uniref:sigma intracellular receptor 2-like n=1 Tax=Gigantopelta aegis TaxID=1735272 RepID=UPI001B889FBA|nr:sigma intracellular receptor 2-like [Gigantopelta aegis]